MDNIESALSAVRGGAHRIELCSALALGGLTPSVGVFKTIKKLITTKCDIFIMIRPKYNTDFVYDDNDINAMEEEIKIFAEMGANGFVFGCLTQDGTIDVEKCKKLLEVANGFPCTFHRAFDIVKNPEESLKIIINLGFSRVLTSGQKNSAISGVTLIKKLVEIVKELKSDVIIIAGGGINSNNLKDVLLETGINEFHGSAAFKYFKEKNIFLTDESEVKKMIFISQNVIKKREIHLR